MKNTKLQPYQIAAKKLMQNHLAEAHKQLAAAEKLSGENHIFHFHDTGKLNDLVDGAKELADLCAAADY